MHRILLLLILMNSFFIKAQETELNPYRFTEVIKVDSTLTAKILHSNAKIWFTSVYKDPREVVILDDVDNGVLIGRGAFVYNSKIFMGGTGRSGWITYNVKIQSKDGRYKYEFYDFSHQGKNLSFGVIQNVDKFPELSGLYGGSEEYKLKVTKEVKDLIEQKTKGLIESLKEAMKKESTAQEDW